MPEHEHASPFRRLRLLTVLAAVAVTVCAAAADPPDAFAAACAGANVEPTQTTRATVKRATLCLINAERRERGLSDLRLDSRLTKAARRHSRDMVRRRYFSHTTPDGVSFVERIRRSGYLRTAGRWLVGENLAWTTRTGNSAADIVRAWMHSPPHREEILQGSFRDVGIGIVVGAPSSRSRGATYTTDFGVKR